MSEQLAFDLAGEDVGLDAGPLREIDGDYLLDLADALNRGRGIPQRGAPEMRAWSCRCDRPAVFAGEACLKCGRVSGS
jgi:hypothetical protein